MDSFWDEAVVKLRAEDAKRGQLFADGNYAMFIHWGLYSQLANKVDGKTYCGIGEWIMIKNMAGIPVAEYQQLARQFNPVKFDVLATAHLAEDAGMKYISIAAKHHDGFAMYRSKANSFNIVDAIKLNVTPAWIARRATLRTRKSLVCADRAGVVTHCLVPAGDARPLRRCKVRP